MNVVDKRPNILILLTDQQRFDSLGCYGSNFVNTPCIDKLAENGMMFNRAYCSNPVCTPSRVSLFTGNKVGSHGAWNIGTVADKPEAFISSLLGKHGYSTWYIGKMHFSAWATSPGNSCEGWYGEGEEAFKEFKTPYYGFDNVECSIGHTSFGNHGHYGLWLQERLGSKKFSDFTRTSKSSIRYGAEAYDWELLLELHNSTWVADRTINALRQAQKEQKPFLMTAGFQDPHHPHCLPAELIKDINMNNIPLPQFKKGELEDKPPHFKLAYEGIRQFPSKEKFRKEKDFPDPFSEVSLKDAKLSRAYYYSMVELVDRSVERILKELEDLDMMDNTIIIFTSDHGELLGDHGLWRKGPFHYEQLVRVPLIVHWPEGIETKEKVDSIVSLVDMAPTILEAAGIEIPGDMDGRSLLPIMHGKVRKVRDHAFIEYVDDPDELRLKTIVTDKNKLTLYHKQEYGELYDLEKDPWETVNLYSEPAMKDVKITLMKEIFDEMEDTEKKLRLKRMASS